MVAILSAGAALRRYGPNSGGTADNDESEQGEWCSYGTAQRMTLAVADAITR